MSPAIQSMHPLTIYYLNGTGGAGSEQVYEKKCNNLSHAA